uniref:protein DGCR6-like isoform X2 n=1 Tax=Myxine glutinosa TaxID=7769 RepID=UPI00358FD3B4
MDQQLESLVEQLPGVQLSELSSALADGTVLAIVKGLAEIQEITEEKLAEEHRVMIAKQEALLHNVEMRHVAARQGCLAENLPLLEAAQRREIEALDRRLNEERKVLQQRIVLELDQKVEDQQNTLEKAGVPGFFITSNPQEISLQIELLSLILKNWQEDGGQDDVVSTSGL